MDPSGYLNSSSTVRTDRTVTARRASQKRIQLDELDEIDTDFDEAIVNLLTSSSPPPPSSPSGSSNGLANVLRNMPILSSIPFFSSGDNQQNSTSEDQQQHEQCRPPTVSPQQNSTSVSCIDLSHDDDDNAIEIIDIKPCKRRKMHHRPNTVSVIRPRPHTPNPSSPPSIVDICDSPSPSASGSKCDLDTTPLKPTHPTTPNLDQQLEAVSPPLHQITVIKCPICLDEEPKIQAAGGQLVVTTCGHVYCKTCIAQAIKTSRQCPKCRKKLNAKSYHPIYI